MLGGAIDVLTLDGIVSMKIPAGTQPGAQLSLREKGIRHISRAGRATRGNQFVRVKIQVPTTLTARQRELLEEFRREEGGEQQQPCSFAESAWRRLKQFMNSTPQDNEEKNGKNSKDSTENAAT